MRIVLLHNPAAGPDDHSATELVEEIARAGHQVIACIERRKELVKALELSPDLVIAAGGDGTVGKAARVLDGTATPLAIIPLGTANNIAYTLSVSDSLGQVIGALRHGQIREFDLATVSWGGDPVLFLEAFGYGAFPRVISQTQGDEDDVGDHLARDRLLLRARFETSPPRPYRVTADGQDLSGDYFLVEVLNLPWIGPRVSLAPGVDPSDGLLDLVVAREADRPGLLESLDRMIAGGASESPLRAIRAERIEIRGEMRRHHVDGELHEEPTTRAKISVRPHALRMLVGSSSEAV